MYEEIFNDVQKVKDVLEKAGIKNFRLSRIFNLLETLKSPTIVAQVFMESKELNNFVPSSSVSDISVQLPCNHFQNISKESEIEVLKEIKNENKVRITVDLTKIPNDIVSKTAKIKELIEENSFSHESLVDYINENSIAEDNSMNQNDLSNDSDVENYYTTSDYEEDIIKKEEKEIRTKSPPPILSILKDLCENPILPNEPTHCNFNEISEIDNFEILEENNNDPNNNNNLGEIQLVEQCQPKSPVAGCSKDFFSRESERTVPPIILSNPSEISNISIARCSSDNSFQDNLEPQPSCSKDFIELEESDSAVEDHDFQTTSQVDYEKLLEETKSINRCFPDLSGDMIFSMLDKYKKATNRITIVLWELLPRERPEPNFSKNRTQNKSHSASFKEDMASCTSSRINNKTIKKIQQVVRNNEKHHFPEIDMCFPSTEDQPLHQSSFETVNNVTNDQQKVSFKDKDEIILSSKVIKPAQFTYQSKPISGNQSKIIKKNVLSTPKLILNTTELNFKSQSHQSAPKRKLSSPTEKIMEERYVTNDIECVNRKASPYVSQNSVPLSNIKKINKPYDEVTKNKEENSEPNFKKLKNIEKITLLNNIISLPNFAPPNDSKLLSSGFQKYYKINNDSCNIKDIKNETLENFSNVDLPDFEIESTPVLEFLKPNGENQFYQTPLMSSSTSNTAQFQFHSNNNPIKSTSSMNPLKCINHSLILPDSFSENTKMNKGLKASEVPCKDTYYKLRSIFPDINPEFIKQKCISPPFDVKSLNMEQQLNMYVEILLTEGSNHRQIHNVGEESDDVGNKNEQYENLLGIFPEADPMYLRNFVDNNYNNPDSLKNFIQKHLENPSYPTRTQNLEKIKITHQIKEYTTDFNVQKFLQIFPDPVVHFENPDRICTYKPMANEFLKDIFRKHKVATISHVYRRRQFHLSLTANELTTILPDMKGKRNSILIPTEDIPLLQEIAYIKHKTEIVDYLEDVRNKELLEFENLKKQGMLIECQCCFNDECLPRRCFTCENGHAFCHTCISKGTASKMGDGQNHVSCFANCDGEFSLSVLQEVLPPITFSILLQKRQEAEVMAAGLEGLVSCPFCHFASIPPAESKVFKCLNPDCMKETCRMCKELNHVPLKCDEILKEDQARLQLEERMTEALVRNCYKCQKPFFKEEGCNKMTCVCGASMCYLCSTPLVKGDYKHFNGQGASNANLCPLWTDNRRLNAEVVRKVAEFTENELKKKNPNLKVNTKAILPALPPKTRGPHDDIPNANALPEHVRRIANITP